jgi:hypothetical protein
MVFVQSLWSWAVETRDACHYQVIRTLIGARIRKTILREMLVDSTGQISPLVHCVQAVYSKTTLFRGIQDTISSRDCSIVNYTLPVVFRHITAHQFQ